MFLADKVISLPYPVLGLENDQSSTANNQIVFHINGDITNGVIFSDFVQFLWKEEIFNIHLVGIDRDITVDLFFGRS